MTTIPIVRLPHAVNMNLPSYATEHAAGMDLMAAIAEPVTIEPGKRAVIATGIAIALPIGFEAQVRPRSGLAANHGVTILNSPGTIDADYRGEIKAILVNLGDAAFTVEPNSRIAQLIVAQVTKVRWETTEALPVTVRGDGGFGSTGSGLTGV